MPTLTREQLIKINNGAKNGYKLDINRYVNWGNKALDKYIKMNETEYLRISLDFELKNRQYNPVVYIDYQKDTGNCFVHKSGNFSKKIIITDIVSKTKQFKLLQNFTSYLTEEFEKNMVTAYNDCDTKKEETDIFSAMSSRQVIAVTADTLKDVK